MADRRSKASGTTREPEPPPQLPNVDAAQQFYIYGSELLPVEYIVGWHSHPRPTPWDNLVNHVAIELGRLQELRPGWDGHMARPITPAALRGMVDVLGGLLEAKSEAPQIFPLPSGGVHIEWLAGGDDIEIEVDNSGAAHVLAESAGGEVIAEGPLDPAQSNGLIARVARFLEEISARVAAHSRP